MSNQWHARTWGLRLALLIALVLVASQLGVASAVTLLPNHITGMVTRDTTDGAGIAGAQIIATRTGEPSLTTTTGNDGSYSLPIPSNTFTYTLNVRPPIYTTTSPDWVATADPLLVTAPPNQSDQNFVVASATVTLTGALKAPGNDTFGAGNFAYVRAENQEGQGNTVQVQADGSFSLLALPGPIKLSFYLQNQNWSVAIHGLIYNGQAGETIQVEPNPIPVILQSATISGQVKTLATGGGLSSAPQCIPVRAWRLDGGDYEDTLTDSNGNYTLHVISGTWALRAVPLPDQLYGSTANSCTPAPGGNNYYVPAESPQVVQITSDTGTVSHDLQIAIADVTVNGSAVDGNGNMVMNNDTNGRVYALYFHDGKPTFGPTTAFTTGMFDNLRLSTTLAQTYTIGLYFPPSAPYTALARATLKDLAPNDTKSITLPIALDNSHITGHVVPSDGSAYPVGLDGIIWGASNSGGWARTRVNPADGSYDLTVAATDVRGAGGSFWRVGAFVDPVSGYLIGRPRLQRVFVPFENGNGTTISNVDFNLLKPADFGEINGFVTGPPLIIGGQPTPIPGARVIVREVTGDGTSALERSTISNFQGRYSIRVPAGTYQVHVALGPVGLLGRLLIPPAPVVTNVVAQTPISVNLHFRLSDALVKGQVTYNSTGHAALVWAKSNDGVVISTIAQANGNYELHLHSGQSWAIRAVSSDQNLFLKSSTASFSPNQSPPANIGPTLELVASGDIPDRQLFTFAANTDQLFTMGDGSQVQVPAGAMANDARNILLTVRPLPELSGDGSVTPVSFGYRLEAFDLQDRRPITSFYTPVTLVIPFTAAQLQELGVTADRLVPSYWDEASASWKPVDNVSVTVDATGGGTVSIMVEHFTDYALMAAPGGNIYLPLIQH